MRIKFCGITRLEDAEQAAELGAWAIGLIHWRGSERFCDPANATEISAAVRRRLEVVGVFVNPSLGEVATAAENAPLSLIQLHGDEGPAFCQEVARRTGCKVIKALGVKSAAEVQGAEAYRTDFHLFDAHHKGRLGGTGKSFDWQLVGRRRSQIPAIVAGGLRPENVADAVAVTRPFAVDVASGTESAPGVKDHAAMSEFAERARAAADSPVTA